MIFVPWRARSAISPLLAERKRIDIMGDCGGIRLRRRRPVNPGGITLPGEQSQALSEVEELFANNSNKI